jgi:hypothetical protein
MPSALSELLVMRRLSEDAAAVTEVQPHRFERVHGDIAAQCHELVVDTPRRPRQVQQLRLAPHRPGTALTCWPWLPAPSDGRSKPMGDIVHTGVPVRATGGRRRT